MRISYDETVDAAYITLANSIVKRTVEIDPGTLVDVDAQGTWWVSKLSGRLVTGH